MPLALKIGSLGKEELGQGSVLLLRRNQKKDAPALIEMYSCERSQVQYVALSSPRPNSTRISRSSSARISLARASSTFSGSPLTRSCNAGVPSCGTNETETLVGSISNPGCEYPTAQRMRPQLASWPCSAHLTSEEVEMVEATLCAPSYVGAPYSARIDVQHRQRVGKAARKKKQRRTFTVTLTNFSAPSPSRTIS